MCGTRIYAVRALRFANELGAVHETELNQHRRLSMEYVRMTYGSLPLRTALRLSAGAVLKLEG